MMYKEEKKKRRKEEDGRNKRMLISVDIETSCNVPGCPGGSKCYNTYKHALHFKKNKIDVIGCYWEINGKGCQAVFRTIEDFNSFLVELPTQSKPEFVGHNFKFDIKTLLEKGANITKDMWVEDTYLMAHGALAKVPQSFLDEYEQQRIRINKQSGTRHRNVEGFSLKTLAPYFCDVTPFWEVDNKDDDEYVIKDCKYTYMLYKKLKSIMETEETTKFYKEKLLPWTKFLTDVEMKGIRICMDTLHDVEYEYIQECLELKNKLNNMWCKYYREYKKIKGYELVENYLEKYNKALDKKEDPSLEEINKISNRYYKLFKNAYKKLPNELNLDSPIQLMWLLKDKLKYNVVDPETEKESTGKEVLERLALEGYEDIKIFQKYRKTKKLMTSFFPTYREKVVTNEETDISILYCTFDPGGTRTGRLSAKEPNLQQVPKSLHKIFVARPGYKLVTRDMSAIEPHIIAYLTEDERLCNIMLKGDDFHGDATISIMDYVNCDPNDVKPLYPKERSLCKQVDLSLFYGSGVNRLLTTALKHSFQFDKNDSYKKIQRFKEKFSKVFDFKKDLDKILIDNSVTNVMGRKVKIIDRDDIYMKGFNSLVQGSASDIVLNSGYKIQDESNTKTMNMNCLLLVHDELVIEIPEGKDETKCVEVIERNMTNYNLPTKYGQIKLKVEGTIGNQWEK